MGVREALGEGRVGPGPARRPAPTPGPRRGETRGLLCQGHSVSQSTTKKIIGHLVCARFWARPWHTTINKADVLLPNRLYPLTGKPEGTARNN